MREVLKLVKPASEERDKIRGIIKKFSRNVKLKGAKTEVGGSIAKDTWLKGEHDIDIYAKFSPASYSRKDISAILKRALEKKHEVEDVYGSRTYYRIREGDYLLEIIPILEIKNVKQAKNITDISPFHVKYVKKHSKLTDDIRIAKAFCKANNLYGAESYIQGFSGYALEILTIHHGSFDKLMKAAAKWEPKMIIDPEKHYKYRNVMHSLNRSKTVSPLILIDPVQADRNAAAGLGREKYEKLIQLARAYSKKPSLDFFKKKEFDADSLKKKALVTEADATKERRDVAGAKLLKAFEFIKKELRYHDFEIKKADWQWEPGKKALLWFELKQDKLADTKKHYGPPLELKTSVNKFKQAWKGEKFGTEGNKCYVIIKREHTDARELIGMLLKDRYLNDKAKRLKLL